MRQRVVIDTNCLLRMIPKSSPYRPAWQAFRDGRYILCVSNEIISEYMEILERETNLFVAENIVNAILKSPFTQRIDPQFRFHLIAQDPDDNKFVDCAIIAGARYIVSEDAHFKAIKNNPFSKVKVVSLDDFLYSLGV